MVCQHTSHNNLFDIHKVDAVVEEHQVVEQTIVCFCYNVRELSGKLEGTINMCFQVDLKVIVLTETWLPPDVTDKEVSL